MTNPYEAPQQESNPPAKPQAGKITPPAYAYVVAIVGALLVFCGALAALLVLPFVLPLPNVHIAVVAPYALIAFLLAAFAAVRSFMGTIRSYSKPKTRA